ncbi:VC0807 family protein [Alteribacter natronophilus]|uniref:VC0807 family protein n=1 Tax=Alteribacter natronophilus TaxID=2583810 RepID=UPI001AEE9871|nr:VC0807 family protein [Alteribacter natronophilus]
MKRKNTVFFDLLCYVIIPFTIWNYGREPLGDYYAILLSTVPGIIYTLYRFISERQLNLLGLFIITNLSLTTLVNLLSGSAEAMLWNQVYLGFAFASVFLVSMLLKRPLGLYFNVDVAYMQGQERSESKRLYFTKGIFRWFQVLTALFVLRGVVVNSLKAWLIVTYGVDGYGLMLIYMQIANWTMSILIGGGFALANYKAIQKQKEIDGGDQDEPGEQETPAGAKA